MCRTYGAFSCDLLFNITKVKLLRSYVVLGRKYNEIKKRLFPTKHYVLKIIHNLNRLILFRQQSEQSMFYKVSLV